MPNPYRGTGTGRRWLAISLIAAAILALLAVIAMLVLDGGEHRPRRHTGPHTGQPSAAVRLDS